MFFFSRAWNGSSWVNPAHAANSLGLFAGHPADSCRQDFDFFAELPAPRAKVRPGWRVSLSPSGFPVLICGWIDNVDELAAELDCSGTSERIYGAAVERWGASADSHVVGEYSSLMCMPDGTIRLSRSPWGSLPLFFHHGKDAFLACSIPRPFFAAGLPKRLRPDAIDRLISFEVPDSAHSNFEGIENVPGGAVLTVDRGGVAINRWYDPANIPEVRFRRDADYVEAANAMLAEATAKALKLASNPAVPMSGGLDSSMVCDEILRQLPPDRRLKSYTFVPLREWGGDTVANYFGNDGPAVEAFARTHPQLDAVFVDNRETDFLTNSDQMFLAADAGYPANVIGMVHIGVMEAARQNGHDWMLTAGLGNHTFSTEAPWAAAEFFRTGRWGQLWKLAAARDKDPRPMWRRLLATGVMPNLPGPLQNAIRSLVHGADHLTPTVNPYLQMDGRLGAKRQIANSRGNISDMDFFQSKQRLWRNLFDTMWLGGELGLGQMQMYGIRVRDVLAYRPLIELCAGMPTTQFFRDGERRYLARRIGIGRMPEAQRTEHRHGDHLVDWHARLTPLVPMLRAEVQRLADHPDLGSVVDTERMLHDLDNWPENPITDIVAVTRLRFCLPAAIYIRRYVDFTSGRNPQ